jgi:hypothetical protein
MANSITRPLVENDAAGGFTRGIAQFNIMPETGVLPEK